MRDRVVSHYQILAKIGVGGMGEVYKALDTTLGRTVALKFLPPGLTRDETAKKRFLHEAQAASALDHPNICNIYEIDETPDGRVFISMAYYQGVSLKERVSHGPLPIREVFEIVCSIADGLAAAHVRGIVHRDIKPGNIVITADGFVKIVDFGLAKLADRSRLTRSGVTPGTLAYMSPEQVKGHDVDGRTDIWSLGVLAYEALTGTLPFTGEIEAAMIYRIVNEDFKAPRELRADIPRPIEAIIVKCLAKDPSLRFATAADLVVALLDAGRQLGWHGSSTIRSVMRVGSGASNRRRLTRPVRLAVIGFVAVVLAWLGIKYRNLEENHTTAVRLAVIPVDNLARSTIPDALADGLAEWLTGVMERLSARHRSMWVVPYYRAQLTALATERDAREAFGVNRLMKTSVQRFGNGHRIVIELMDAGTLRRLGESHVDFGDDVGVQSSLVQACAALIGMPADPDETRFDSLELTATPAASSAFLEGLGYLQRSESGDNLARAAALFEISLETDSLYADAHAAAALAELRAGDASSDGSRVENAWSECLHALALDSSSVYVNLVAGDIALDAERMDDAVAAFRRVRSIEPGNTTALLRMGKALDRMERVDEAERAYRLAVELKPDYWEGHINLGYFLYKRGRIDEAIERYEQAISLAPNDWWTLNTLGAVYFRRDEWSQARRYFLRSFAVRPRCYPCTNVGTLYYLDGQFSEAAKYFKLALEYCDSTAPDYYQRWQDWGAALYWIEGRQEDALEKFRHAIDLAEPEIRRSPHDAELLSYMAGCHAMLGDRSRALELVDRVTGLQEDNPLVAYHVGWTYEKLGDRERALAYLAEAVRMRYSVVQIRAEPLFRDLIEDIRFKQLVEMVGEAERAEAPE